MLTHFEVNGFCLWNNNFVSIILMIQSLMLRGLFWASPNMSTFKSLDHKKESLISVYIKAQILKLFPYFLLLLQDKVLKQPASKDSLCLVSAIFLNHQIIYVCLFYRGKCYKQTWNWVFLQLFMLKTWTRIKCPKSI